MSIISGLREEILLLVTTWIEPGDMILREIRQSQEDEQSGLHSQEALKVVRLQSERGMVAGLGRGKWEGVAQQVQSFQSCR